MVPIESLLLPEFPLPPGRCPRRRKSLLPWLQWQRPTHIRLVYCRTCKRSFSERKGTVLEHARLPDEKALAILNHLREGCGTRATGRLIEVDKNTVTRYLAIAGAHAEKTPRRTRGLFPPKPVRSRSTRNGDSSPTRRRIATRPTRSIGSAATIGTTRRSIPRAGLLLALVPGKRDGPTCERLIRQVHDRTGGRTDVLLTSDEHAPV